MCAMVLIMIYVSTCSFRNGMSVELVAATKYAPWHTFESRLMARHQNAQGKRGPAFQNCEKSGLRLRRH